MNNGGFMVPQRIRQIVSAVIMGSLVIAGAIVVVPRMLCAEEVVGFASCFTDEELAKVREWEKTWVGKKIDNTNVDQVAEFLLPSYVNDVYKNYQKWNEKEPYYFYIVPYQRYMEPPGVPEATKKYASSVKTNAEGVIINWGETAGRPFPIPKTGMEMMYNFACNSHGDASYLFRIGPVVETKSRRERVTNQPMWNMNWVHRTDVDPKPTLSNNPKGIEKGLFMELQNPPEMLGTRMYNLRYIDANKSDDGYLWYSQFRRIRRMQTSQRSDTIAGSDLVYDDEYHYDSHVELTTWKYVGRKDMLCARHMDWKEAKRVEGQPIPNNVKRERSNVLVVEGYHKDPDYVYKKKVMYLDPESYTSFWCEMYDSTGKFWKGYENWSFIYPMENSGESTGKGKMYSTGGIWIDFQRTHGGSAYDTNVRVGLKELDQKNFTINALQKGSYGSH
jgi:hypothetical protein